MPVRKRGKLPPPVHQASYEKEYGSDYFEIGMHSIQQGQTVVVLDDLIATGGSAKAAGELIDKCGGRCVKYVFLVELPSLQGRNQLNAPVYSLVQF